MAQLGNLLVTGSSRLLGKLFCNDISVGNSLTVKTLSATNFTATSITTSGLTVNGNATTTGTLSVGNSQANGKISINGKVSIRDYANNGWLGINDTLAWTNGVYFGKTTVRTDGIFQVGDAGNKVLFNQSSAKFTVPVTINNSLAANNITATNVTVNDTLKAFKYELNTIQDLGGEFCVAPTIYIQSGAKVQVNKDSATTIVVSIQDTNAIKSDTIQGVRWAEKSKIKFQGKINGLSIRCNGVMKSKLNTVQNTMSLILTVDSNIANSFSTSVADATSYSDISVMLYQRVTKNSQAKDVYYPVGIRMSATGSANSAPYVDIWGSKLNSDPDTVYTVPSVRLGYLNGLKCGTYDCVGYGLYADNVYLNGTIISNSGTIGGFNITTNALTNGTWGTDKSVLMCTGTDIAKSVGGSSVISGWCFTAGSKFGVTTSGDLYASNANISGIVTSENGKIGGFTISQYNIKGTNVGLGCASGHDYAFWAGASTGESSPFHVGHNGALYASNATITGSITTENLTATGGKIGKYTITDQWLTSGSGTTCTGIGGNQAFWAGAENSNAAPFRVGYDGKFTASNATITGSITTENLTATGGKIGKYTITDQWLTSGSGTTCTGIGGNQAFWAGAENSNAAPFRVGYDGKFTASNATITGDINANNIVASAGNIGGWQIGVKHSYFSDGSLYITSIDPTYKYEFGNCMSPPANVDSSKDIYESEPFIVTTFKKNSDSQAVNTFKLDQFGNILSRGWHNLTASGQKSSYNFIVENGLMRIENQDNQPLFKQVAKTMPSIDNINQGLYTYSCLLKTDYLYITDATTLDHSFNYQSSNQGLYCDANAFFNGNIYHNGKLIAEEISSNVSTLVNLPNGTWTKTGTSIKLSTGVYIIIGWIYFKSADKGRRGIRFINQNDNFIVDSQNVIMTNGSEIMLNTMSLFTATYDISIYLQGFQSSGSSLGVARSILKAVRIA